MKLRAFLFLVLFFSSFSVFAATQAEAFVSCRAAITGVGCSQVCALDNAGRALVVLSDSAIRCAGGVYPFTAAPVCSGNTPVLSIGGSLCGTASSCMSQGGVVVGSSCQYPVTCTAPLVVDSATNTCVPQPPKVCTLPLVNDPNNSQNCIAPTAVTCTAPAVRDSDLTSPTFNTCVTPLCPVGQSRDSVSKACVVADRPTYCSAAFQWDGVSCSLASSKTTTTIPAPTTSPPTSQTPAPTPTPPTQATTEMTSTKNPDGSITTTQTVKGSDGSVTTNSITAPAAGSSANYVGQGACNSGDACDQSAIKKNTADTAKSAADTAKSAADTATAINKLNTDLSKQSSSTVPNGSYSPQYQKTGKTVSGVFTAFSSSVSNTPLVGSVSGFFTVSPGASSCPVWQADAMGMSLVIDHFCQPLVTDTIFPLMRVVLTLVFSFYAFRVAFL